MGDVSIVGSCVTFELNKRIKVDNHPLWGSQCLLTNREVEVEVYRDFLRSK